MALDVRPKRIYDPLDRDDGYRILIDHIWPRGVSRERACLDEWARELAPSDELRRWFDHRPARFAEFRARYRDELGGRVAGEGVRIAQEAGLQAEPLAVEATGPVWTTILEIADRHDAATIVMGSRGLTGLRSMLLGSVSNAVVHHTARPTLIVRQPHGGSGIC